MPICIAVLFLLALAGYSPIQCLSDDGVRLFQVPYLTDSMLLEPLDVYGALDGTIGGRFIDTREVSFSSIQEAPIRCNLTSKRSKRGFDLVDVNEVLNQTTGILNRDLLRRRIQHELDERDDDVERVAIVSEIVQRDTAGGHKAVNLAHIDFLPPGESISEYESSLSIANSFGGWNDFAEVAAESMEFEDPRQLFVDFRVDDAFNLWAPIDEVVKAQPLAFLDKRTFHREAQTRMCLNAFAPIDTTVSFAIFQGITYHTDNHWLYRDHMKRGEAWRFNSFDSVHSAIDSLSDHGETQRQSCEVRVVILARNRAGESSDVCRV